MATKHRAVALVLGLVAWGVAVSLGEAGTRLHLKDGSYQLVRSYEVQGDRVRYYNLDSSSWEEVPLALVDLVATERARQEQEKANQQQLEEVRRLEKQRFDLPPSSGFEVAPGIRLPEDHGVYVFDGRQVTRLLQSPGEMVRDKKRLALTLALPVPVLKNRALVILQEATAAVRVRTTTPTFYIHLADTSPAHWELLSLKPGKSSRLVESVEARKGKGEINEQRTTLEIERTEPSPGIISLKAVHALAPGEYALGELDSGKLNLEVWDFGVDESAAN